MQRTVSRLSNVLSDESTRLPRPGFSLFGRGRAQQVPAPRRFGQRSEAAAKTPEAPSAPFAWRRLLQPLYSPKPPLPHPEPVVARRPLPAFVLRNLRGVNCEFDRVRDDASRSHEGTVEPVAVSYFAPATTAKPKAIALFYHGFAAGPFEFHDWTERLNSQGVAVYAVRAPGHGEQRDGKRAPEELPRFGQTQRYADHARDAAREAEDYALRYGIPLYIGGFSMGGAMALDAVTAPRRKAAAKLLLIAPLLRPGHLATQHLFEAVRKVQDQSWVADFVDRVPAVGGAARNAHGPGYYPFPLHRAWAAVDYASQVHKRASKLQPGSLPPALLIGTLLDVTIDRQAGIDLVNAIGSEHRMHMFPPEAKVDHAMVGSYENPDPASLKIIEEQVLEHFQV